MSTTLELVREFQKLGCEDEIKLGVAARVYVDLVDVAKLSKVEPFYDAELKEIYFMGTEKKENVEKRSVYLPTSCYEDLDFNRMEEIQEKLCKEGSKSVVLCICDASSTVVYYRLTQGFDTEGEPSSTGVTNL